MKRVNSQVAERLAEVARTLEAQGANVFRVGAYRRAEAMLRGLERPIDEIVKTEGIEGLQRLPGIGETLARFIHQLVVTGRLPMLDRLRAESDPITVLRTVPGIGKATAQRLYDELGIETLEELEAAAHDGRLTNVWVKNGLPVFVILWRRDLGECDGKLFGRISISRMLLRFSTLTRSIEPRRRKACFRRLVRAG